MNLETKERFINFLRGFAMFLMLWGHSIQFGSADQVSFYYDAVFKTIYTFHMPLLMLISGYLFFFSAEKRNFEKLFFHKTQSMMYPLVICSAFYLLLSHGIRAIFTGHFAALIGSVNLTTYWFLWSVLSSSIALTIAVKTTKKIPIQCVLTVIGIGIVAIFPWWDMSVFMYPYFVIGYLCARNEKRIKPVIGHIFGVISTSIYIPLRLFFDRKHYIYTSGLNGGESLTDSLMIDFYRWATGFFGCVSVIWIMFILFKYVLTRIKKHHFMEALGKDSLAVYIFSSAVSFWLPFYSKAIAEAIPTFNWNDHIVLYDLAYTMLLTILTAIIILLLIKLLKKVQIYKFIFGRE